MNKMKAEIQMHSNEDGVDEIKTVEGSDMDEIRFKAGEATESWMREGEWGDDGATLSARWSIVSLSDFDEDDDLSGDLYGEVEVDIEPDHSGKIREAVGDAEICGDEPDDHEWTSDGEGGVKENPGVWSTGGTSMTFDSHCRRCGLHRHEKTIGSQRNPSDHDAVEYRMLDDDEIAQHRENGDMEEKKEASAEN